MLCARVLRLLDREPLRGRDREPARRLRHAFGRAPDFVDGHQHVHLFPQVRDALLDVVKDDAPHAWVRQCGRVRAAVQRLDRPQGAAARLAQPRLPRAAPQRAACAPIRRSPAPTISTPRRRFRRRCFRASSTAAGRQRGDVPSGLRRCRARAARPADHAARARIRLSCAATAFPTCCAAHGVALA